jgi:hypothetical protein
MRIDQRFRSRKDLHCHIVYFEHGDILEMSGVSAFVVEQLREDRTRGQLIQSVLTRYPRRNAKLEVDNVIETLRELGLLS